MQRNKEESIKSLLGGLELKYDIDKETKKWFNKSTTVYRPTNDLT
jgi:hypothetical protein